MSLLTKMYEQCAKDCVREAERTADPKYREQLLKWAREWREAAAREASTQSKPQRKQPPAFEMTARRKL
jgi:hypothetical protein